MNQGDHDRDDGGQPILEATRCAHADGRPHRESEVEAADRHDEPFQDVRVPRRGVRRIPRIRAFQPLAPVSLQSVRAHPECAAGWRTLL